MLELSRFILPKIEFETMLESSLSQSKNDYIIIYLL